MKEQFSRTGMLLGGEGIEKLEKSRIAIFGVGGVGGYVCEALVRSGVGAFDIVDNDTVALSNINRQIIATHSTVGRYKVDVMKERMLDINPEVEVRAYKCFFLPDNADEFPFEQYDYVVDAVDTVTAKVELIMKCHQLNIPVISAMGAGNKLDPGRFKIADIYDTTMCPLARVMRQEMKKRGIKKLKVVYSDEKPVAVNNTGAANNPGVANADGDGNENKNENNNKNNNKNGAGHYVKPVPGSSAFVPSVAGLMIAGEIVRDITGK